MAEGRIRTGIGGWTYEPWRKTFYPEDLPHSRELEYASRQVTAIEVNGTYYSTQKPASFARWRDETPDDFMFTLKATRYATNRQCLGGSGGLRAALRRQRDQRAGRQAGAHRVAVRAHQGLRRAGFRGFPGAAAGRASTAAACAT